MWDDRVLDAYCIDSTPVTAALAGNLRAFQYERSDFTEHG